MYLRVMVLLLSFILIVFLVYQMVLVIEADVIIQGLDGAEEATGTCTPGNISCVFEPTNIAFDDTPVTTYSANTARIMADLIGRIEYAASHNQTPTVPDGMELIITLKPTVGPVFCGIYLQTARNRLMVVFRGTKTAQEWNADLHTNQVQAPMETVNPNVLVHEGFLNTYNSFIIPIRAIITERQPTDMLFTGHSLGAAVATILCFTYQSASVPNGTYSFASPRVGNVLFSQQLSAGTYPLFRLTNQADIVPTLPPSVTPQWGGNFQPYLYNHAGTSYAFNLNWGSWNNNHLIPIYLYALANCTFLVDPFTVCG